MVVAIWDYIERLTAELRARCELQGMHTLHSTNLGGMIPTVTFAPGTWAVQNLNKRRP
jgi:hypothetical protein